MGRCISKLTDSPNKYCIYLVHEWDLDGIAKSISERFREYSTRLGDRAVIFAADDQDSYDNSFHKILQENPWFKSIIKNYYDLSPGIIITNPGLPQFSGSPGQVFIYVSDEVINLAYHEPYSLSQNLVDLCRYHESTFIEKILPYSRETIVDPGPKTNSVLELLRESIMIEPNIHGFGFKVKPIVDHWRNPEEEQPKYDCVVYQF